MVLYTPENPNRIIPPTQPGAAGVHNIENEARQAAALPTFATDPVSPGASRSFAPKKPSLHISGFNFDDYEARYPEDQSGEETGPNARVWRVYLDEALREDTEMVDRWRDGIDVLLVFAGLFSAVVTAFLVESTKELQPDHEKINTALLMELIALQRAAAKGINVDSVPVAITDSQDDAQRDLWINGLWVASLVSSLSTALMATVVRQWMQYYVTTVSGSPRDRVRIRQLRHSGFERWAVKTIVGIIPLLLHVSVFLFLWGLFLFFFGLSRSIAWSIACIGGSVCAFYLTSAILPLFFFECPYRTPLAGWVYRSRLFLRKRWNIFIRSVQRLSTKRIRRRLSRIAAQNIHKRDYAWPQSQEIIMLHDRADRLDVEALMWMATSPNQSVQFIAAQALGSLHEGNQHAKPRKLASSGLEDAAIRMHQPSHHFTAEAFDRVFRTYLHLSKWRLKWLSGDKFTRLTAEEKREAIESTIRIVERGLDVLEQEHLATLTVQKRIKARLDRQNGLNANIEGEYETLKGLEHEYQVRISHHLKHVEAFGALNLRPIFLNHSSLSLDLQQLFSHAFDSTNVELRNFTDNARTIQERLERLKTLIGGLQNGSDDPTFAGISARPLSHVNSTRLGGSAQGSAQNNAFGRQAQPPEDQCREWPPDDSVA